MGALRLLLALSVVAGHSNSFFRAHGAPFFLINAKAAVGCFFVISGFYMALVLNEKYTSRVEFIVNRAARIYIPYIVVTICFGAFLLCTGQLTLTPITTVLNVTLLGQDLSHLYLWHDMGAQFIVLPHAWSLAVELTFYFAAALLFRGAAGLLLSVLIGLLLTIHMGGLGSVMIAASFFVFFALGGASYVIYREIRQLNRRLLIGLGFGSTVALAIYAYMVPLAVPAEGIEMRFVTLYCIVAAVTPFIFAASKRSSVDRFFGDLSYPMFLTHLIAIATIGGIDFSDLSPNVADYTKSTATLLLSTALALVLLYALDRPLEKARHRWGRKTAAMFDRFTLGRTGIA